ncbi:MAG: hypothetical protein KAI47_24135 [Deltaproteobacteria bacterium]|nr:hypothetical protein [Deltaproteobacteria bacterium]
MTIPQELRHSYLARQVGSLVLSPVALDNAMGMVRAAAWHNTMLRLGVPLPLFVIHDLGQVLSGGGRIDVEGVADRRIPEINMAWVAAYGSMLEEIAKSDLTEAISASHMRDDLMAVLLAKLLGELRQRWRDYRLWVGATELPLEPNIYLNADEAVHYQDFDGAPMLSLLAHLVENQMYLLTAVEQIDLDTLRLLGMFQGGGALGGVMDIADLLSIFSSPEANGVVNFSMELLPSVLETRRQGGVQSFSIDGYASVERRGSIESIVLSEFAYDDDIFIQKVVDNELYYYGHEKEHLEERSLHYILVDSSASMRGEREVFARGLALTLSKKLSLQGNEVWLRFFDSRLYDILRISGNSEAVMPHLLCFRSERGRNYGRVFRQLLGELRRLRRHEDREVLLYIITHGQCHIGLDVVTQLALFARLYGVFILPSSGLHLDYLPAMDRVQIVDEDVLSSRERSVDRALEIVDDASAEEADLGYGASGRGYGASGRRSVAREDLGGVERGFGPS